MTVYLDNAATTKPYEKVVSLMGEIHSENYGNPSSSHSMGHRAEKILKSAGETIGSTLNTEIENLIFTSGGTEADNMALMQPFYDINKYKDGVMIISSIEHPAVNSPAEYISENGAELVYVPVNDKGLIDCEFLKKAIRDKTLMISVMYVNNEVGTIQPIKDICSIKKEAASAGNRVLMFHTDAVQAYGKFPIDLSHRDYGEIDLMTISAHKIHGPKGVGALFARNPVKVKPLLKGGGQQFGHRSGTENVAGIAGFAMAAEIQHANLINDMRRIAGLRKRLLEGLIENVGDLRINSPVDSSLTGEAGKCIPNILSVSFLGTRGEVILNSLEQKGIFVSTESACSSKKRGKSPVLSAMGMNSEEIEGTIRFSISTFNKAEEIDYTVMETKKVVDKFRKLTGYRK